MSFSPGASLGSYVVVGSLGAGGMGEVYRARDTRLNRDVAIKVLPELFAADPERLTRFEREAQTLAALNHPNVAQIFGVVDLPSESGSLATRGLVMECVDGDDLSLVIARGAVPMREALPIARQIADALDAAHELGIVHRDLKPGNVKVRADGTVKVLDFGLAKALGKPDGAALALSAPGIENSPTFSMHATQLGVILGTAAYMAPEQARARAVDKRADIWAFGVLLFELITGRRLFDGEDTTAVLAQVLERDPEWTLLPATTPPAIRRLLERCLQKDPKARLRDIGDARHTIDEAIAATPSSSPSMTAASAPPAGKASSRLPSLAWGGTLLFALLAGYLYVTGNRPPVIQRPLHAEVVLPGDVEFFTGPSLTADGSKFAFVGVRQGVRQMYVRSFEDVVMNPVAGTETAMTVAMSPDGSTAAFVTNDTRIKLVTFSTGIVEPLADGLLIYSAPAFVGPGAIAFSRSNQISVRSADGAEHVVASVNSAAGETALSWVAPVAGDQTILFVARKASSHGTETYLDAVSVDGTGRHRVLDDVEQVLAATADRLVFGRQGTLFVAPFDSTSARVLGPPVRLGDQIVNGQMGGIAGSIAASGAMLAASPSILAGHLAWVSLSGAERPIAGAPRGYLNPRVSPDGKRIAFSEDGSVWTLEPERGTFTRVTAGNQPTVGFPVWSPDGSRLYYRTAEGIHSHRSDGEGEATLLSNTSANDYPSTVTPDGSALIFLRLSPATGGDLYEVSVSGGELKPVLVTKSYEGGPQVSPDGKWLLYISNESARMEVLLRPLHGADRKWTVSTEGGMQARWSNDGRQIYYRSGQRMLAVDMTTTPEVHLGAPRVLFEKRWAFGQNVTIPNYSLSADGREFLMIREEPGARYFNLVINWLQNAGAPRSER